MSTRALRGKPQAPGTVRKTPSVAPGRVRIIGGRWKRTPLPVVGAQGLRPTPDRVRETLFNWLGASIESSRCLDLFAGTGALGLEAASRGAARVVLVERDRVAADAIRAVIERLGAGSIAQLIAGDALAVLSRLAVSDPGGFDIVFLDPPFGEGLLERALPRLLPVLAHDARVYVESESALSPPAGWELTRADRAGQVHYHLLVRGGVAASTV